MLDHENTFYASAEDYDGPLRSLASWCAREYLRDLPRLAVVASLRDGPFAGALREGADGSATVTVAGVTLSRTRFAYAEREGALALLVDRESLLVFATQAVQAHLCLADAIRYAPEGHLPVVLLDGISNDAGWLPVPSRLLRYPTDCRAVKLHGEVTL